MTMQDTAGAAAAITASVTGGMIALFGPVIGVWAAVFFAALTGAMWTVGRVETSSIIVAAFLLLRTIVTAMVLTGAVSVFVAQSLGWSSEHVLPLTAFVLGALGDKFEVFRLAIANRVKTWIGGKT